MNVWDTFANKTQLSQKSLLNYYILQPSGDNWDHKSITLKSRSSMECGLSVYSDLILNGCCLVNLKSANPTCRLLSWEPIKSVAVIRLNLIGH